MQTFLPALRGQSPTNQLYLLDNLYYVGIIASLAIIAALRSRQNGRLNDRRAKAHTRVTQECLDMTGIVNITYQNLSQRFV